MRRVVWHCSKEDTFWVQRMLEGRKVPRRKEIRNLDKEEKKKEGENV